MKSNSYPSTADTPTKADFLPTASWANLRRRGVMLRQLREFFHARGYLEVETPLLSSDTVVDRHLDPFTTVLAMDPRFPERGRTLYLQTSPELAMKRLLAGGGEALVQITRSFRNGECGRLHNPEFTIVEWYRVGDTMSEQIQLLCDMCQELGSVFAGPVERLSYQAAFERHVGLNPHAATIETLVSAVHEAGLTPPPGLSLADRDGWLDFLLVERIEPHLGFPRPTILFDYPASQSALACVRAGNPPVAERFELYVRGIELANGYHELLDTSVLRARNVSQNALRVRDGKPPLPEESRLLAAMDAGLPPCSGVALGFDRLLMLAAGASSLEEVLAFPMPRA